MLESYDKKRDFTQTPEPPPVEAAPAKGSLRFVIQKHSARQLHYDFRLEVDGVLKSWAVPKGPSLDPQEKRLARQVEDHPIDYASFEGGIPKGSYGAGEVIVWDAGVYSPDEGGLVPFDDRVSGEERMRAGLEDGKLSVTLRGHKLRGSWTVVRTARSPKDWLLIKHRDSHADDQRDVLDDEGSVLSGLTLADLKAGRLPDSVSGRDAPGHAGKFPSSIKPMLARLIDKPFSDPGWLFEPKLDGFRVVAFLLSGTVTLRSRNGTDLTEKFPDIVRELSVQPERQLVLDGEVVALTEKGLPDFGLLQRSIDLPSAARMASVGEPAAIKYYPFDVLYLDGMDLTRLPLHERKALLTRVLLPADLIEPVEFVATEGEAFYRAVTGMGLEGVVAKRRDSFYETGGRSGSWLKVKDVKSQSFVIGGYTEGAGARASTFGSLVLGYYEDGKLRYAGRAGSGFDERSLKSVGDLLGKLQATESPFDEEPELDGASATWVRPELVAEVKFNEWTAQDKLRAPVFVGLREDLDPRGVQREVQEVGVPFAVPTGNSNSGATSVEDVLDQLSTAEKKKILEVDGHRISLTNLDKVLWPAVGGARAVTKGDMVRYYTRIGPSIIPHLRDRPLTLTRYPDGIDGESFYQKRWEHDRPDFVEMVELFSSHNEGDVTYLMVNNLPTLIWLAQLADIEMHPWMSRVVQEPDGQHLTTSFTGSEDEIRGSVLNYPDFIVFDLDPYIYSGKEKSGEEPELNRRAFKKTVEVAWGLKAILDELKLSAFIKTSGKTGLHIYVPVVRQYNYRITRKTCETVGRFLMQGKIKDVTMEWTVGKRTGKVFLDHNQNVRGKNMASIYSLRPAPNAPVSTPVTWDELDKVYPTDFTIDTVPERVEAMGDLWSGLLDAKHDLGRLLDTEE